MNLTEIYELMDSVWNSIEKAQEAIWACQCETRRVQLEEKKVKCMKAYARLELLVDRQLGLK